MNVHHVWSRRLLALLVMVAAAGVAWAQRQPSGPAYLLIALPSHRVIAESRREILATPIAPGSLMKLLTLAAAFEQGVADEDTRVLCRRTIDVDGRPIACVHPDFHRGLSPIEALGHSCNVYFGTLARRLDRSVFDGMLVRMGLRPSDAATPLVTVGLGLGGVRATPPELLEMFCRLTGSSRADVRLPEATRRVLRLGLELAATSGTAAAIGNAGFSGLAKTGTAPMPGGGYQGIVTAIVNTELPTHAIVVVAPGSTGAHAGQLAAEILVANNVPRRPTRDPEVSRVAQTRRSPSALRAARGSRRPGLFPRPRSEQAGQTGAGTDVLRVGIARRAGGYEITNVPREDYVARGVAGEGGDALPRAALQTLAITVRTYALANRGRHAHDGFDLCDLTHCLSLRRSTTASREAATATAGRILTANGKPAEVYLSAWCGGHTERPSRVWDGASDPPHLPARPDPACAGEPAWSSDLAERDVRRVAESAGLRGALVDGFDVVSRTSSGRADRLRVTGMAPDVLSANAFRLVAGRLLGWQIVKSTLFDIVRTSTGYRLRGKGLGHGVGLCVRGAAARAGGGATPEAILSAYFPGLSVTGAASRVVRVLLPEADRSQLAAVREHANRIVAELAANLGVEAPSEIEVRFHPTVESYTRATGMPWWTSGRVRGTRIDVLPIGVLAKRSLLESTLRHEIVHVLTDGVLAGRPLWVREGLALVKAGEFAGGGVPEDVVRTGGPAHGACPSDVELRNTRSPDTWRLAYESAGQCVARALAAGTPWRDLR